MPVNSFEDYPMSWKPDRQQLKRPYYESIAAALEKDIVTGVLQPDVQLPPQRELADFLDLNLSTITRAYRLCESKGYLYAVTGRGSFVNPSWDARTAVTGRGHPAQIEMGTVEPFYQLNDRILHTAQQLMKKPSAAQLFEYTQPWENGTHMRAAAQWLQHNGAAVPADHLLIVSGGQNALTTTLLSLFQPGDKIAADPYTYPNFIGLASLLHLQLIPVRGDASGMLPEELERACRTTKIKGVYLMPSCGNPTGITIPMERREQLAAVLRHNELLVIEDDTYSFLLPPGFQPLYQLVPERTIYICGTSKPICAGLRVAFMAYPEALGASLISGAYHINLKTAPINSAITVELIESGEADRIAQEKKQLARQRNALFAQLFPEAIPANESAFFHWLPIGSTDSRLIESLAESRGVRVLGSRRFAVGSEKESFLRVATCSPKTMTELETGLHILRELLDEQSAGREEQFIV